MFQVLAPVTIHPTAEARSALGDQLRAAGLAAWQEIARRGQGLELAHLQFCFAGVTLAGARACAPTASSPSSWDWVIPGKRPGSSPRRNTAGPSCRLTHAAQTAALTPRRHAPPKAPWNTPIKEIER